MPEVKNLTCPCCGGSLRFDAASQNVKCPYCDTEFSVDDLKSYDEELEKEFKDETDLHTGTEAELSAEDLEGLNVFLCESCGGEIIAGENTSATICPYCGNPVVIQGRLTQGYKPRYIIPFKKDKAAAVAALSEHLKHKPLLPRVFKSESKLNEIQSLYVPFWLYDADVDARLKFSGTRERTWSTESYDYKEVSYDSLIRAGKIGFEHLPVDASSSIPNNLSESVEPYDFSGADDFKTTYLAGYLSDKFDVSAEDNSERAVQRMKETTVTAFRSTTRNFDNVRTESCNVKLSNTNHDYALFPMHVLNATWRDKKFTFGMNGQTGKFVGDLPTSPFLFALWLVLSFVVLGALFGVIGFFASDRSAGGIVIGLIFALVVSLIIVFAMKKKNKSIAFRYGSADYIKPNSWIVEEARDIFLYKKITKKPRNNGSK